MPKAATPRYRSAAGSSAAKPKSTAGSATKPARRRDAAATREAILTSARAAFARAGYDGAGVREIAAGAGVTAMLVNRYFGSKEQLFAEVVEQTMTSGSLIAGGIMDAPDPGAALAAALLKMTAPGAAPLDGFLISLHSASSSSAAAIGRQKIEEHHLRTVTEALAGRWRGERAALLLAVICGLQVMRQMIGLSALTGARDKDLAKLLGGIFDQLIAPPAR